jgi:hypothetical protein
LIPLFLVRFQVPLPYRFRIMDNTLGYEPGNRSSILLGDAKFTLRIRQIETYA